MGTNAPGPEEEKAEEGTRGVVDAEADARRVVIVGGGQLGRRLAERLVPDRSVHHVDEVATAVASPSGYEASHAPDITSATALATVDVTADDVAVVFARRDSRTLLVTQLLRTGFGVERVCAVLNDPRNRDAFDIPGVTVVCGAGAVADAVLDTTVDLATVGLRSVLDEGAATDVTNTPATE
jgi:Trk K+ transport system NAD-binding subunit